MENGIQQNTSPIQSLPQTPPLITPKQSTNWSKILLFTVLGFVIVAGSVFVGIQIGKNQTSSKQPIVSQPTITPSKVMVNQTNLPTTPVIVIPTTDSTVNWKTYESTRFKFSFKYPQTLMLDNRYENKYTDQGGVNIYSKEGYEAVIAESPRGGDSFIEVWVYPNPQSLSLLEWMKSDTSHSNYSNQTHSSINIDGEAGYIYTTEGMGQGLEAVVAKNKQIYMFADLGFDTELKQIISTFKFTK